MALSGLVEEIVWFDEGVVGGKWIWDGGYSNCGFLLKGGSWWGGWVVGGYGCGGLVFGVVGGLGWFGVVVVKGVVELVDRVDCVRGGLGVWGVGVMVGCICGVVVVMTEVLEEIGIIVIFDQGFLWVGDWKDCGIVKEFVTAIGGAGVGFGAVAAVGGRRCDESWGRGKRDEGWEDSEGGGRGGVGGGVGGSAVVVWHTACCGSRLLWSSQCFSAILWCIDYHTVFGKLSTINGFEKSLPKPFALD
ncbi:hypothetical protein Tco_0700122 [Tanacetum coccineum]